MFTLAKTLGMTVEDLGRRLSTQEMIDWAAFFQLESENTTTGNLRAMVEHELTHARRE